MAATPKKAIRLWKRKIPKIARANKLRKFSGKGGKSTKHHG